MDSPASWLIVAYDKPCCFSGQALGIECYVGISFGPVFTATIGGARREFMLVGDVVNTAGEFLEARGMEWEWLRGVTGLSVPDRPLGGRAEGGRSLERGSNEWDSELAATRGESLSSLHWENETWGRGGHPRVVKGAVKCLTELCDYRTGCP